MFQELQAVQCPWSINSEECVGGGEGGGLLKLERELGPDAGKGVYTLLGLLDFIYQVVGTR